MRKHRKCWKVESKSLKKLRNSKKVGKWRILKNQNQEKLEIEMKSKTEIVGKSVSDENNLQSISVVLPKWPVYEKMASIWLDYVL